MTRPPVADPDTAALIERMRHSAKLHNLETRHILITAADELTRLSALSLAAHEATQALVEQAAETERRCAQIRHLQDGLREAMAENRRKDETIARLTEERGQIAEACARVCESRARSLFHDSHRISESVEAKKCASAIRGGWLAHFNALAKDGTP